MTTATPAHAFGPPDWEPEVRPGTALAVITEATTWRVETVMPRWRPTEDEIVRAAITVILVALGTIIALAAMAILTMG